MGCQALSFCPFICYNIFCLIKHTKGGIVEQVSLKIGERLKEIRNTRQLTLDDVAELTGVSKPMLGQIERGQSSPTINI